MEKTEPRALFNPEQAGDYLGVKRNMVFNLIASGELPSIKIGRCRRIPREELDRFISRKIQEAKAGAA